MNKRRVKDLKTGKVYGSIVEAVREAETYRSAVYKSLRRGGRWEYTDEDLRRRDCMYYEKCKCKALSRLFCETEGADCWRYTR